MVESLPETGKTPESGNSKIGTRVNLSSSCILSLPDRQMQVLIQSVVCGLKEHNTIRARVCDKVCLFHCVCFFNSISGGDVPPKKLQALQKVLQSEFCNAIREV